MPRSTFSQPLKPPEPTAATFSASTHVLTVTFDRLLKAGTSAPGNWQIHATPVPPTRFQWGLSAPAVVSGATVTGPTFNAGASIKPTDQVSYAGVPPDLIGRSGLPVAPFLAFPLTIVP